MDDSNAFSGPETPSPEEAASPGTGAGTPPPTGQPPEATGTPEVDFPVPSDPHEQDDHDKSAQQWADWEYRIASELGWPDDGGQR